MARATNTGWDFGTFSTTTSSFSFSVANQLRFDGEKVEPMGYLWHLDEDGLDADRYPVADYVRHVREAVRKANFAIADHDYDLQNGLLADARLRKVAIDKWEKTMWERVAVTRTHIPSIAARVYKVDQNGKRIEPQPAGD